MAEDKNKKNKIENLASRHIQPVNLGTIFFGILLIFFGLYILAQNLNIIPEQYQIIWWNFWPLIFIFIGLSFIKVRNWTSAIIGVSIIVVIIGLLGFFILWGQTHISYELEVAPINISLEDGIDRGLVDINFGAGSINIAGGSEKLVDGYLKSNVLDLRQSNSIINTTQEVNLDFDPRWRFYSGRQENYLNLDLNKEIPMDILFDSGATTMDIDLSDIKAELVDINTGASDLNLTMGEKAQEAKLSVDAGASSINIDIPRTIGVNLLLDSGVTSKNIVDFEKVGDKEYRSRNYNDVNKYLMVDLNLGVSNLKINWIE